MIDGSNSAIFEEKEIIFVKKESDTCSHITHTHTARAYRSRSAGGLVTVSTNDNRSIKITLLTFHDNTEPRFSISDKSCEPTFASGGNSRNGRDIRYTKISSIDHSTNSADLQVLDFALLIRELHNPLESFEILKNIRDKFPNIFYCSYILIIVS